MSFDYSRKNKRWQNLRRLVIPSPATKCRECARYGKRNQATIAHHVWPAEDYPEFAYCLWNLLPLCSGCHDKMHDRITRKLTALGIYWKNKTPPGSQSRT